MKQGLSLRVIAAKLGPAPSTVAREVRSNGGRRTYRAWRANQLAIRRLRRPRPPKLASNVRLWTEVERLLTRLWSPLQISAYFKRAYRDDEAVRISHEATYQALFVQGRGALRKELTACLRSGRASRRRQGRVATHGTIRGMVMISERPAEIKDRVVSGH